MADNAAQHCGYGCEDYTNTDHFPSYTVSSLQSSPARVLRLNWIDIYIRILYCALGERQLNGGYRAHLKERKEFLFFAYTPCMDVWQSNKLAAALSCSSFLCIPFVPSYHPHFF